MLANANPLEANRRATQLFVRKKIGIAHAVATAGLRRNFQPLKPSMGASFHAPPAAVAQPPAEPTVKMTSSLAKTHVIPTLGSRRLVDLTPEEVVAMAR
jgi:hypothetical protein